MLAKDYILETLLTTSPLDLITPWWYTFENINVILFFVLGLAVDVLQFALGSLRCQPKSCLLLTDPSNSSCELKESALQFMNLYCTSSLPWYITYYPYLITIAAILMLTLHRLPILWPALSKHLNRLDSTLTKLRDLDANVSTYIRLHCQRCDKCKEVDLKPSQSDLNDDQANELRRDAEKVVFDRHGKLAFSTSIPYVLLVSPCSKMMVGLVILYILRHHYMFISTYVHFCSIDRPKLLRNLQPIVCIQVSPVSALVADWALLCVTIASLAACSLYIIFLGRRAIRLSWQRYYGINRHIVTNTENGESTPIYLDTRRLKGFVYLYDVIKACDKAPIEEMVWLLAHGRGIWGEHVISNL